MANPHAIIANAFERLKRSISEEDAHNFASTELKDVWLAVREIDNKQRKRQSAQNLRRIEPLLRGIEKYTKVIEVLCNGTPFMPYIWAPIKLMLETASHYRDIFEELLLAYADIGAALPRFDRYNKAFDDNLEFQHVLAAVYTEILNFHQRTYKFFRQRAWHVIFLSLWKDFRSRFDCIINSLKKHRDFVDVEAASFDIIEAKEMRIRMQDDIRQRQKRELEMLEENEKNARIFRLYHSISWLSYDEKSQEIEYERMLNKRYDRTCEWVANDPHLKSWIKDDLKYPCLWLNGKPGLGKSVMCSYIIQSLTNIPGITPCYYFCNSQDTGNVCHQILKIVVLQILRQHPDISTLVANEFVYRGVSCGMPQLRILVPQLLEVIAYVRIVVDGIDECSTENQKAVLKELQAVCIGPTIHCKVLFSSRREGYIYKKLSKQLQISLDGYQEVDWDIRSFIKYKITKIRIYDQDLLGRIESILVEKANGMFLWVRLVIDELKSCYSDAALEETVTSLPKGLIAAYGRILDRIMDHNNSRNAKYMAIRILEWMACSYRTLKTYELLDGISFNDSNTTLTPKAKIRKDILDLCRPLIEEGPASTVEFVHFSAKEYILNEEYQAERPFILRENAHLDILFSCVACLNSCVSLLPANSTESQRAATIVQGFHSLQVYANMFWCRHLLEYCVSLGHDQQQFSTELLTQLQFLLRFRKDDRALVPISKTRMEMGVTNDPSLEALDGLPALKRLVSDVLIFRAKMKREDTSDKSSEKISLDSCEMDPTHFSAVRHHYQQTVEFLLEDRALAILPEINKEDLQAFRDTYGGSAFVCRYLHCVFSTNGFESSSLRAKHESQHQRRFRCSHSSCVYFTTGFVTRSDLNKHSERYHPTIAEGPSLAESLQPPLLEYLDPNMVGGMQNKIRHPSSHPGFTNQLTPKQMAMARQQNANANWPGGQNGQIMPRANPGAPPQGMAGLGTLQQRQIPLPAAPAGATTTNGRAPGSPQQGAAPPTPQQAKKPNPKKKNEMKDTKAKQATKKGSAANLNSGATPPAESAQEPASPTPAPPIIPIHPNDFKIGQSGAVQPIANGQSAAQPMSAGINAPPQPDPVQARFSMDNAAAFDLQSFEFATPDNGNSDILEEFDFDSFLRQDAEMKLLTKSAAQPISAGINAPPQPDPVQASFGMDNAAAFDLQSFEFATPDNGNSDILEEFDFDSFLRQDAEMKPLTKLDASSLLESEIGPN